MDWLELLLKIPLQYKDKAEAIANMVVPYGFYLEDYSDLEEGALEIAHIDLIDEDLVKKDRENVIIHIYISTEENCIEAKEFIMERFTAENIPYEISLSGVNDNDWKDNWKKFFKCCEIGEKLVIRPSWEEYENKNNRIVLSIDPGAAFGTGTHATTKMCLTMLEKYVKIDSTMLDIGCGSGILSIAAALLGAKSVLGVDIDALAVKISAENSKINNVTDKTTFFKGDLVESVKDKFDIVCANIVADVIIGLSENVDKYIKEDGLFICSGIIDSRSAEVVEALHTNGFEIVEECECENWRAYVSRKIGGTKC